MQRIPIGLTLVVGLASCVIPPQQPAQPVPWGAQPAVASQPAAPSAPGTCEAACGQIASCELVAYDACIGACDGVSAEQLDAIAHTSCEQLAASVQSTTSTTPTTSTSTPEFAVMNEQPSTSSLTAGRWISTEWASVTNAAMTSADFYLAITVGNDGAFHGSWARYICLSQAYGIWSCSLGPIEGSASGQLDAGGGGRIQLERLGTSALAWTAKSAGEILIELPRDWQGDRVLFRSSVKR
jgi:hypothetical protein